MKALITGSSSGIGKAIAEILSKSNIDVYLTGRNEERLIRVEKHIRTYGVNTCYSIGDVKDSKDVKRIYSDAIDKMGQIDILVANAGVGYFNNFESLTDEEYDNMFETNVRGVFNWVREVLPEMKKRNSGQIIIISSTAGLNTFPKGGLYCATKHAVQAIAQTLRLELEGTRVKVGTINPGAVNTPWFNDRLDETDGKRKKMLNANDVAKSALLLATQSETSNIEKIVLRY